MPQLLEKSKIYETKIIIKNSLIYRAQIKLTNRSSIVFICRIILLKRRLQKLSISFNININKLPINHTNINSKTNINQPIIEYAIKSNIDISYIKNILTKIRLRENISLLDYLKVYCKTDSLLLYKILEKFIGIYNYLYNNSLKDISI
jgi:hypothetical protein